MFQVNFPRLERVCLERGLFFCPLDLRWGVTGDQSGAGEVINICLDEIDRSRPYFVCQLGFRNGWALSPNCPEDADWVKLLKTTFKNSFAKFPWVKDSMNNPLYIYISTYIYRANHTRTRIHT